MKKFLLTTYYLDFSGSSTYIYTLATVLKNHGFQVDIFAIVIEEEIKKRLSKNNIYLISNLIEFKNNKSYDFIIAQHSITSLMVRGLFPYVPMIYISHGIKSFLENPPSQDINIQQFVAVSEEVKEKLITACNIKSELIHIVRNFIDTKIFYPHIKIRNKPRKVLFISYRYNKKTLSVIKKACRILRLDLMILGKKRKVFDIEKFINQVDIVISLGRGILEAMSCGRAVIVFDYSGGDGMIDYKNIDLIKKCNFSGRCFSFQYDAKKFVDEIMKYNSSMCIINRKIILKWFNADKEVEKILVICKKAKKKFKVKNIKVPVDELWWLCQRLNYFASIIKPKNQTKILINFFKK